MIPYREVLHIYSFYLKHVVQREMSEALAGEVEGAGGFLHLVGFVSRCLCVLHLCYLQILPHLIKVLLRVLEFTYVTERQTDIHKIGS